MASKPRRWLYAAVVIVAGAVQALVGAAPAPALSPVPSSTVSATPTPTATPTATATPSSTPTALPGALVYVANADSGPVTAYTAGSTGAVTPVRTVGNPNDPNTVWDPWGVTFDRAGNLYVQTFLSDATTFVFPPGASGTTPPSRIFQANAPDNTAVAVDSNGYEYVAGGEAEASLFVELPGANGVPGNLYHVSPARTIPLPSGFNPWPSILTVDSRNEVLVAVASPSGNSIEVFSGGVSGGTAPVRVISGPDTGLGACASPCDELSIFFSPLTGRIYAAVSDGATTHISVFAGSASGDALPVRTIQGPATGLAGNVITGIAASPADGTIYAMVKTSQFGTGHVNAYARFAAGNVAPLTSFTDASSAFVDAAGIAVAN